MLILIQTYFLILLLLLRQMQNLHTHSQPSKNPINFPLET